MGTGIKYDEKFKKQALKPAQEIENKAAADKLGIPRGTLEIWLHTAIVVEIDTGTGTRYPEGSLNLTQSVRLWNKSD